jgi:hypothetical protein
MLPMLHVLEFMLYWSKTMAIFKIELNKESVTNDKVAYTVAKFSTENKNVNSGKLGDEYRSEYEFTYLAKGPNDAAFVKGVIGSYSRNSYGGGGDITD